MQAVEARQMMIMNSSPSFDEDDDYSDYSYSTTSQSCQSSMTGSFQDDSIGDLSPESFARRPLKAFGINHTLPTLGLAPPNNRKLPVGTFAMNSPGTKAKKKADIDRAKRMIARLDQAELNIKMKDGYAVESSNASSHEDSASQSENPEAKLQLQQIDIARNFFQRRINQNFVAGPVPMEILNIVKSVSAPSPPSAYRVV